MIHPMWAEFYRAVLAIVYEQEHQKPDETYDKMIARVTLGAARLADMACMEYDNRDKSESGSPYRG